MPRWSQYSAPLTSGNLAQHDAPHQVGNIVLCLPIPTTLLPARVRARLPGAAQANTCESLVVRYSAINCRPNEFVRKGYKLRPFLYSRPRQTRLLVSVKISDADDEDTIRRTLDSIICNVDNLKTTTDIDPYVSWKQVVVVLFGSTKTMRDDSSELLRRLGLLPLPKGDPSLAAGTGWAGELYEYTTLLNPRSINEEPEPSETPCQLVFFDSPTSLAVDEAHVWIVRAFAEALKAEIWVSVEPGKQLNDIAFVTILREFQENEFYTYVVGHRPHAPSTPIPPDRTSFFLAFGRSRDTLPEPLLNWSVKNIGDAVRAYRLPGDQLSLPYSPSSRAINASDLLPRSPLPDVLPLSNTSVYTLVDPPPPYTP